MKGVLENVFLTFEKYENQWVQKEIKEALLHRINNNNRGLSQIDMISHFRDSISDFNVLVHEASVELTNELKGKSRELLLKDKWYREVQLSSIFRVTRGAVTNWKDSGYFPNFKQEGGKVLIPKTDIDEFVKVKKKYKEYWEYETSPIDQR